MRAIARAHASTRATGLMRVKNSMRQFCLWHLLSMTLIVLDIEMKKMKDRKHQIE